MDDFTHERPGVLFVGTGEAFDAERVNCSVLLEGERLLLCDCGPTVPAALWRQRPAAPVRLDAVFVSHLHGDHVFGVPFLLARMREDGREKPLSLIGQPGIRDHVERLTRLAYPSVWDTLGFSVELVPLEPGREQRWQGYRLTTAWSDHSSRNGSLRVDGPMGVFCYGGDGAPTTGTAALFRGADVLVHESFVDRDAPPAHASARGVVALARAAEARTLALVHVNRRFRDAVRSYVDSLADAPPRVLLPVDGDRLGLAPDPGPVY